MAAYERIIKELDLLDGGMCKYTFPYFFNEIFNL
ncbi:MAG: hypothetical protein JWQ66_4501 [Mucilaginibacter sp.]|nr:hypothetical protein [Mucilaginibacter sp.]